MSLSLRTTTLSGRGAIPDYAIYGLTLRADRALAGLYPAPPGATPDVTVHLGIPAPWAGTVGGDANVINTSANDPDQPVVEVSWSSNRGGMQMRYVDDTEFHVSADGRDVWATWQAPMTLADTMVYLLGPVLGFVLRQQGVLALHASANVIDGQAAAFCGPRGAGKSTTAAAFAQAGFAALSDDVLALRASNRGVLASPAYDHLRLWDDSAQILVGDRERLPLLTPNWDKRAFAPESLGHAVSRTPAPLGWIFLLEPRAADDAMPRIEPVGAADAFIALTASTSANYLLDQRMRGEEFRLLSDLVARTAVFRLTPHADPLRVQQLIARVLQRVRGE